MYTTKTFPHTHSGLNYSEVVLHWHPIFYQNRSICFAILLFHSPKWVSVKCSDRLSNSAFCFRDAPNELPSNLSSIVSNTCSRGSILKQFLCFGFFWNAGPQHRPLTFCKTNKYCQPVLHNISRFQFLFDTMSKHFPPVVFQKSQNDLRTVTYHKLVFGHYLKENRAHSIPGIQICSESLFQIEKTEDTFKCKGNIFISHQFVCNNETDCVPEHSSDEIGCTCNKSSNDDSKCKYITSHNNETECSMFYYQTHNNSCKPYVSTTKQAQKDPLGMFECKNGERISFLLVNDLLSDCGPAGEDENVLALALVHNFMPSCRTKGEIPCQEGHFRCYNVSDICIFQLNMYHFLEPCRTGQHLQQCQSFECHDTYKCPGSYCLKWKHVCDGRHDCPGGLDENINICGREMMCQNMFKCHKSTVCIHINDICDGTPDCRVADDEFPCLPKDHECPTSCSCFLLAIHCSDTSIKEWRKHNLQFLFVSPQRYGKHSITNILPQFQNAVSLVATSSGLEQICKLKYSKSILTIDFHSNAIMHVSSHCFSCSVNLKVLSLSKNKISHVCQNSFSGLTELVYLDLSTNNLSDFSSNALVSNISILNIEFNPLDAMTAEALSDMTVQVLKVNKYFVCCIVETTVKCTAQKLWHMSCSDLLPTSSIEHCVYVSFIVIVICSVVSFVLQVYAHTLGLAKTRSFFIIVSSVDTTDLLCAATLFILLMSDHSFGESFVLKDKSWKSSHFCFLSFVLSLTFAFLSPGLLSLLSFCRLMVVKHPLDSNVKQTSFVVKKIFGIFTFSLVVSVGFTILVALQNSSVNNNLCSPFVDYTNQDITIHVVTWITIVLKIASAGYIFMTQVTMVMEIKESRTALQESMSKKISDVPLVAQVACLTICSFLCWIPSGVIFLLALYLDEYSTEMLMWTTIAVVPLNSIVNPIVFIATTARKIHSAKKH